MANTTGKKHGGRKKGTPNKSTQSVKAALTKAFDDLGGVAALVAWGRENETEFYKLWVRIIPAQLNQPVTTETPTIIINVPEKPDV